MELQLHYEQKLVELQRDYFKKLQLRLKLLLPQSKKFCYGLLKGVGALYDEQGSLEDIDMEATLTKWAAQSHWQKMEEFWQAAKDEIEVLLGKDYAHLYHVYLSHITDYPLRTDAFRRSVRSSYVYRHSNRALAALRNLLDVRALNLSDEQLLDKFKTDKHVRCLLNATWLATHLLENDRRVREFIREAILSDSNHLTISYDMLQAIVLSEDEELLELEGKLLLSARLQEGLRQAVVETMDYGTAKSQLYLFKIIIDNNLCRYSGVYRGLLTWCGMGMDEVKVDLKRIPRKLADEMYLMLTDTDARHQALESSNHMEMFVALWAMAFYELENVRQYLVDLMHEPKRPEQMHIALFAYMEFCPSYEQYFPIFKQAISVFHDDMDLMAIIFTYYLGGLHLPWDVEEFEKKFRDNDYLSYFYESKQEAEEQFRACEGILSWMKRNYVKHEFIFPWIDLTLERKTIALALAKIALIAKTPYMQVQIYNYLHLLEPYYRVSIVKMISDGKGEYYRRYLFQALRDRSSEVRMDVFKKVNAFKNLSEEEILQLLDYLRLKYSDMRSCIIQLLMEKLSTEKLSEALVWLLDKKCEEQRLAALDVLSKLEENGQRKGGLENAYRAAFLLKDTSEQEKILLNKISGAVEENVKENFTMETGLGLLDDSDNGTMAFDKTVVLPELQLSLLSKRKGLLEKLMTLNKQKQENAFDMLVAFAEKVKAKFGAHYRANGSDHIYGQEEYGWTCWNTTVYNQPRNAEDYPFLDYWKQVYLQVIPSSSVLIQLRLIVEFEGKYAQERNVYDFCQLQSYSVQWAKENEILRKKVKELLTEVYSLDYKDKELQSQALEFVDHLSKTVKSGKQLIVEKEDGYSTSEHLSAIDSVVEWLDYLERAREEMDDEDFRKAFVVMYRLYQKWDYYHVSEHCYVYHGLHTYDFFRAYHIGLITRNELLRELMSRPRSKDRIEEAENAQQQHKPSPIKEFSKAWQVYREFKQRLLDMEVQRGDTATVVSSLVVQFRQIEGLNNFINILVALGKTTFCRGFIYAPDTGNRKEMLSMMLASCCPCNNDSATALRQLQLQYRISDERMVEAAMYCLPWAALIEAAIGWTGLASTCWYFRAHTSDWHIDDFERENIARYTPLAIEDLQAGAFDMAWFRDVYQMMGVKRFDKAYQAAKYISQGALHTRARGYADAYLGKIGRDEAESKIREKRNKDLLMSYGIIPLADKEDVLHRYLFISQFRKESRQFGAQRKNSESKAADMALLNLANNAGYSNVTLMIWQMETQLAAQNKMYFVGKNVDGYQVAICISEGGKPSLVCSKGGKMLKSIPSSLKKTPVLDDFKEVYKMLKEQSSRANILLEKAMVDRVEMTFAEWKSLEENPILHSLIGKLVFVTTDKGLFGFLDEVGLRSANDEAQPLKNEDSLRIAHAVDFNQLHVWNLYQQYVCKHQIVQPFKQVFRELYLPTEDEMDLGYSDRFAGYQVQISQAKALLVSRGWLASYEEGFQKVSFVDNLTVTLNQDFTMFTPAEVECPSIDRVEFSDRKTGEPRVIKEVAKIYFSEVMRDIDLTISVAHVGGVDPETSHSTIEMRCAIIENLSPMFGWDNVSIEGNFAHVIGKLNTYNIHIGSGVVHQVGGSVINIVAVHSSHRGRIFLPFIDQDPRTAEVISKIELFAHDEKIKDPFILDQIEVGK